MSDKTLKFLIGLMSVLIVAGVAVVGVTIARRTGAATVDVDLALAEPPGTQIAAVAATSDRLSVLLTGGGAPRIVLVDPRTGRRTGSVTVTP